MTRSFARPLLAALLLGVFACGDDDEPARDAAIDSGECAVDTDCAPGDACLRGVCVPSFTDADGDGFASGADCDDMDPTIGTRAQRTCSSECATGVERCVMGTWEPCDAPADCSCMPGETRAIACERCGTQMQRCGDAGTWVNEGTCAGAGECSPGALESGGPCGACGTQRRTCLDTCVWDAFTCVGEGECTAGAMESLAQSCGSCAEQRARTRTCSPSCTWAAWGEWGACSTASGCTPGTDDGETVACGRCGSGTQSRTRACDATCAWGGWGAWSTCAGETGCSPGAVDTSVQSCGGVCGGGTRTRTRTCDASCGWAAWGSWGACSEVYCFDCTGLEVCPGDVGFAPRSCTSGRGARCTCSPSGTWTSCSTTCYSCLL